MRQCNATKQDLSKEPCTVQFTGIDVKVSRKLAENYYANGKGGMNDTQRIRFQAHKKWLADLSSLETDVICEHTDAAYWNHKYFKRVIIKERHTM
jgi:hypothetical protein